ncbi:MAG: NAD(P)-dependent oxidoreductase [Actinobacteria bacterium]|nr:NAD(P)-dependent oxidoreductase [Actinomycetota bacterium]
MRVAVTGAAGFVGGAITAHLREHGHDVTPLTRREWDITAGPFDLRVDAVVHCAALADDTAPLGQAMLVNRIGTRNVVASAAGARIVHVSTSSVYDAFAPSVEVREGAPPPTRYLSSYSESKAAAEGELPTDAVVLRPHAVYGPGDTTLLPRVLAGIRGSRLVLPEGARVRHTLTHVDNLAAAAALALTGPAGVYNVGDDTDVLLSAVLAEFLVRRGRPDVTLHSIPYRAAFAAAAVAERLQRRPRLTRYAVSQLGLERTLDLTRARGLLGYEPGPTSLAGAEQW